MASLLPPRSGKSRSPLLLLMAGFMVAGAAVGLLYVRWVKGPIDENTERNRQKTMQMVGLREASRGRLDDRFSDADGNLLADTPADPAQCIDPPTLVFSYIAVQEAEAYRNEWKPFTEHLAKVTGKPVEYLLVTNAADQLHALSEGKLHVTGLNSGNVPTAVNRSGFVPVVKLPTNDGSGMSRMRVIVPADSAIKALPDLRGRELTLTDPTSNSGFKAPLVLLRSDFGLVPVRDFNLRYSGGHDASIAGIASKQYQVAAVADDMLDRALARGAIKTAQFRSVYASEKFPTAGLGHLFNLKPELAAKVREAFSTFDWKETSLESRLGSAGGTKFIPADYKNDWALIRRIDDDSGASAIPPPTRPITERTEKRPEASILNSGEATTTPSAATSAK